MRLGIVTCGKCPELTRSERPLLDHLPSAKPVVWNDPTVDWRAFDALLVRSIWDYHLHTDLFLQWLQRLEDLNLPVWNPVPVLRWNHHKFYLRDLAEKGVATVPTLFMRQGDVTAGDHVKAKGWMEVVVKPAVSASGFRTQRVSLSSGDAAGVIEDASHYGDYLVQPFLSGIHRSGEVSLIYFRNRFSHAVLKRPGDGEFRVQAEYGGGATRYTPQPFEIQTGEEILRLVGASLLYARVDGLVEDGRFILMELELIEPDLFLEMRPGADRDFAQGFLACLRPSALS